MNRYIHFKWNEKPENIHVCIWAAIYDGWPLKPNLKDAMPTLCPQHLRVSLKSADILVLDGQMSNATYLVGWRGIGLKTCNVQPAPTVSCHLLASAGHCRRNGFHTLAYSPIPGWQIQIQIQIQIQKKCIWSLKITWKKQWVNLELWIFLLSKRITNRSTNTNIGRAKVGAN